MAASKYHLLFLGRGGHTLPTHRALLNRLSEHFSITLFSEVAFEKDWHQMKHHYQIRAVPRIPMFTKLRELVFLLMVLIYFLRHRVDAIHAHSTYPTGLTAVILGKLFGVPVLVALDDAEGLEFPGMKFGEIKGSRRMKISRYVINQATEVTTLTAFQHDQIKRQLEIVRPMHIVPRGIDTDYFRFKNREQFSSPLIILSVGYLSPVKDPSSLLKSFQMIRQRIDCKLIHVGRDYTLGAIEKLAQDLRLGADVSFLGHLAHAQLEEVYHKADILLHTAVFESQGMVVVEAMACGVLVCGTHVGLMSDLSNECCVTAAVGNYSAIAENVLDLMSDKKKQNELRIKGKNWTATNDLHNTAKQLSELYYGMIAQRR